MGWSGGVFTREDGASGCVDEAAAGEGIVASVFDTRLNDLAAGINQAINKDGTNSPTANLPLGGFRFTGAGAGVARTDLPTIGQIQDGSVTFLGTSAGTAAIQTLNCAGLTAYLSGQEFSYYSGFTNTGAVTMNIQALGAKNLFGPTGGALAPGDLIATKPYRIITDGTNFYVLNPSSSWNAWTPTWSANGAMTVSGGGTNRYLIRPDKTVYVAMNSVITIGGTPNTDVGFTLPVTAAGTNRALAVGQNISFASGLLRLFNASTTICSVEGSAGGNWPAGANSVYANFIYEAA